MKDSSFNKLSGGNHLKQVKRIVKKWPAGSMGQGHAASDLLMECVAKTKGDYIEIGSAFGYSAVLAATAMGKRPGTVYCIDPFIGVNNLDGADIALEAFWSNIHSFGLEQRVVAFCQHNPPFPVAIHHHLFSVGLIDGNHDGDAPLKDFIELDSRVTDYLLFDNAEYELVENTVRRALWGGNWEEATTIEYESGWKEGKMVQLTVLHRITPAVPKGIYEKMKKYANVQVILS